MIGVWEGLGGEGVRVFSWGCVECCGDTFCFVGLITWLLGCMILGCLSGMLHRYRDLVS